MRSIVLSAGGDVSRFEVTCRALICEVKCKKPPSDQCVPDLRALPPDHLLFAGVGYRPGVTYYKFYSNDYLEAYPARRKLFKWIASKLRDSRALALCRENAISHGLILLTIDVPVNGNPTVTVRGEIAMTPEADCVSKALLSIVIDEHVTAPATNSDFPIAVKI